MTAVLSLTQEAGGLSSLLSPLENVVSLEQDFPLGLFPFSFALN